MILTATSLTIPHTTMILTNQSSLVIGTTGTLRPGGGKTVRRTHMRDLCRKPLTVLITGYHLGGGRMADVSPSLLNPGHQADGGLAGHVNFAGSREFWSTAGCSR